MLIASSIVDYNFFGSRPPSCYPEIRVFYFDVTVTTDNSASEFYLNFRASPWMFCMATADFESKVTEQVSQFAQFGLNGN